MSIRRENHFPWIEVTSFVGVWLRFRRQGERKKCKHDCDGHDRDDCRRSGNDANGAQPHFGSSTVRMRSTDKFCSTCSRPLGQRTVNFSILVAAPNPKCTRPSSCDRYPELDTRSAICFFPSAVTSRRAPMPSRLLLVPFRWIVIQWPVLAETLWNNVAGAPRFTRKASILSLIHISEPTRRTPISYAVFCLKNK